MRSKRMATLVLLGVLGWGADASAQATTRATARITIGPVMQLEVLPGGGSGVVSGEYVEVEGAVRVRVSANAGWRLLARVRGDEPRTASVGAGSGPVVDPVWVRVRPSAVSAVSPEYRPVTAGAVVVGEGEAGWGQELRLDLRWFGGSASEEPPGVDLELVPAGR